MGTDDLRSLPLPGLVHGARVADAGLLGYLDPSDVRDKNASSPRQIYRGNSSAVFLPLKNMVTGDCLFYFTLIFVILNA